MDIQGVKKYYDVWIPRNYYVLCSQSSERHHECSNELLGHRTHGQFNAIPAAVINQSPCGGDCMRQAEYIMMDWVSERPNIDGFIGY